MRSSTRWLGTLAGGLVWSAAAVSVAQPITFEAGRPNTGPVNISGATLFRPFFEAVASTNDAIDVDADGFFGFDPNTAPFVDQLAPSFTPGNPLTTIWAVQYRGVGSVNGLAEFVNSQLCGLLNGSVPSELGLLNRFKWAENGVRQLGTWQDCLTVPAGTTYGKPPGDGDPNNDSGTPYCTDQVHIAILDVPSAWGVVAGDPNLAHWDLGPTTSGYGWNPIASNTGWLNTLQSLTRDCGSGPVSLNTNTQNPDGNTIFDSTVAWAAIGYCANRGVARPDLDGDGEAGDLALTDAQHLMVAGRTISGENLAVITRSGGSGTRNGIMNTSGIDPSWGRGDNLSTEWAITDNANLGPNRKLTNAEGSSGVERAMQVSRLGIGYTGLFGNERAVFDANAGRYEILNMQFDTRSGGDYIRPSVQRVVENCDPNSGYTLGGQVTFVTRGDPYEADPNDPAYIEDRAPAKYLENILASIDLIQNPDPNNPQFNMPGEFLATRFTLEAGISCLPVFNNPGTFAANPGFDPNVQAYIIANQVTVVPAYGSKNPAGLVPRRATPTTDPTLDPNGFWLDGTPYTATTYRYKSADGQFRTINRDAKVGERNAVTGDFNRDGLRNIADIPQMMVAAVDPLNFEQGQPLAAGDKGDQFDNSVIVHLMADFNGDGNFDARDVRYFADGLALDPNFLNGKYGAMLNRPQAFIAVDQNWATQPGGDGNYFDTVLATPKAYAAGDAAGDVAGSTGGALAGADPRGADGRVDAKDIDYVYRAFKNKWLGYANLTVVWSDLDRAVYSDLSAELTGPQNVADAVQLVVDQADVDHLVKVILGTNYGDANLDGQVNNIDRDIVLAHLGQPGGWAEGNFDGDEFVDQDDLGYFNAKKGDLNCDTKVDFLDINPFVQVLSDPQGWQQQYPNCPIGNGDINNDGKVDFLDINPFVALLAGPQ